ncbi:unnamed protein product, partial [Meganyctiphanes norvegica]
MGESPIYYIKLPPSNYYYSPKKTSNKPMKKVPISFYNNGKPHHVYHWTQPVSSKRPTYIKQASPRKHVKPGSQAIHIKASTPKQQTIYVKPSIPFRQAQSVDERYSRYSVATLPKTAKLTSAQSGQQTAYVKPPQSPESDVIDQNIKNNSKKVYSNLEPESQVINIKTSTTNQQPSYIKPSIPYRQAQSADERFSEATLPKPANLISALSEQQSDYVKPLEPLKLMQSPTTEHDILNNSKNIFSKSEPKIIIKSQEGNLNKPVTDHSELDSGTEAPQPIIIKSLPTFSNAEVSPQLSNPIIEK